MKKIKKLTYAFLGLGFIYLLFAFVKMSFDATKWTDGERCFCAMLWFMFGALGLVITLDDTV